MGMGLLRWLLWPRRARDEEEDEPARRRRKTKTRVRSHTPGVYRIEVDNEAGRFHREGPPFSFWSSSRVILILSFLLWWIQPAGPMIAGYVGGRRAGSPIKGVIAALMPIFAIYIANLAYAHNFASHQIDFVASLPMVVSDGAASILPFLAPYKDFMIAYMRGFVEALTSTFGMGTNGYLMVVIFAYIGGLIAEQTRREMGSRSGSGSSLGVNLVQPILGGRPYVDQEEEAYDEDEEVHRSRHPVRARPANAHPGRGTRDSAVRRARAEELRSLEALTAQPFYRTPLWHVRPSCSARNAARSFSRRTGRCTAIRVGTSVLSPGKTRPSPASRDREKRNPPTPSSSMRSRRRCRRRASSVRSAGTTKPSGSGVRRARRTSRPRVFIGA